MWRQIQLRHKEVQEYDETVKALRLIERVERQGTSGRPVTFSDAGDVQPPRTVQEATEKVISTVS